MLLDEDPATLIASCAENFKIGTDRASIVRINESLKCLNSFRETIVADHDSHLQQLARQQQSLQSQVSMTTSSYNPGDFSSEILRLENEKFKIAKQASDLEIEGERLGADLESVRSALIEVEEQGPEGGEALERSLAHPEEAEMILKLKFYRDLGIEAVADPATGDYKRFEVRNAADYYIINIDQKMDRMFWANMIWDKL